MKGVESSGCDTMDAFLNRGSSGHLHKAHRNKEKHGKEEQERETDVTVGGGTSLKERDWQE